jgi:hypothetical protein
VPLARVRELLTASQEEFTAAVADIDRRLRAEIRERQQHRERIAQLAAGDSLALPPEVVAYLNRMRELGLPELMIGGERDAWILVAAQLPQHMAFYMKSKHQQLDDPATLQFIRDLAEMIHWEADDPRVAAVGDQLVSFLEAADPAEWDAYHEDQMSDELVQLLDSVFLDSVPIARQLMDRMEARGWHGWTKMERIPPDRP